MDKNQKNTENEKVSTNYDLKSTAVEDLVNADTEQVPEYSEEELKKYRSGKGFHIPEWLKIVLIKAWFYGAVCYFVLWGLGIYISGMIDMLFVLAVVMGVVTNLLLNNVIRFIEKTPGENDRWLLVTQKGVPGFFLDIVYGFVIMLCVFMLYNVINMCIIAITGNSDTVPLGVEPVLFGVFCMGFDMLFVYAKQWLKKILDGAKNPTD